jgi:hypothetical protein
MTCHGPFSKSAALKVASPNSRTKEYHHQTPALKGTPTKLQICFIVADDDYNDVDE